MARWNLHGWAVIGLSSLGKKNLSRRDFANQALFREGGWTSRHLQMVSNTAQIDSVEKLSFATRGHSGPRSRKTRRKKYVIPFRVVDNK
jgi:hypothetical protein